ncbi:hypothetical protein TL16_g12280 [Triparma laevis f. inornata]|uniref:Uncharacterized protein n=1 Tax=Triparma laevis f. inornata TaxID=1714386 RepID=A0A9W7BJ83_9STRA|nr:hypothetical protein TL16_g12280 [Triparma laevis f. inornata]
MTNPHESGGENNRSQTETVVTYSENVSVPYKGCLDFGKDKIGVRPLPVRAREADAGDLRCASAQHSNLLENMCQAAYEWCKNMDKSCKATVHFSVDGFKNMQNIVEPDTSPCINRCMMALCNYLLILPPWYMWFYLFATGSMKFQHKKVYFFNKAPIDSVDPAGESAQNV